MVTRQMVEQEVSKIGHIIAGAMQPGIGFALLVFGFGPEGSIAYASNADRDDMIRTLEELIGNLRRDAT